MFVIFVVAYSIQMEQDNAKASGAASSSLFTRVKGVIFSGAKVRRKSSRTESERNGTEQRQTCHNRTTTAHTVRAPIVINRSIDHDTIHRAALLGHATKSGRIERLTCYVTTILSRRLSFLSVSLSLADIVCTNISCLISSYHGIWLHGNKSWYLSVEA